MAYLHGSESPEALFSMSDTTQFEVHMQHALDLAKTAAQLGEVPVGAVVVDSETHTVIAEGFNRPIATHDPSAHAEIIAIRAAAFALKNYRTTGLDLYVTLEPCAMCAGAISNARIGRVIFGTEDVKGGAVINGPRYFEQPTCHWKPKVIGGILTEPCSDILKSFFQSRRKSRAR